MSTTTTITATGSARVRRRRVRLAAGTAAAGFLIAGVGMSTPAAADDRHTLPTRFEVPCTMDPSMLPRTADAATAWMATCYEVDQLPRTPDAIVAWLR